MMAQLIDRKHLKQEMKELLRSAQVSPRGMTCLYLALVLVPVSYTHLLGIVRKHQPLPNAGEQHDGQQEAQAAGDTVNYGGDEVIVVLHLSLIHI